MKFETLALHAGFDPKEHNNAGNPPIYQTTGYIYDSPQQAAKRFQLKEFGNIYTRITNPTTNILEKRIAALEKGTAAIATASGMSAQFLTINSLTEKSDNILASSYLYGGTFNQLKVTFKKLGVETKFFDIDDLNNIEKLANKKTKAIYIETIGNPSFAIPDFEKIVHIAKNLHIPVVVDNTFATPYLCNPIGYGVNIVVHSMTKYIGGHGATMGGVIIDGGNFDWGKDDRFPGLTQPSESHNGIIFNDLFGKNSSNQNIAFAIKTLTDGMLDIGPTLSPINSFLFLQSLETLSLRMERYSENTLKLAEYLSNHPKIQSVNYPGLKNSPYHNLAKKYLSKGQGGMMSIELKGVAESGKNFLQKVKLAFHESNLGDSKTIVTHPSSTTHQSLSSEEQKKCGITPGLIRISVGLENIDDIIADFEQAF